MDNWKILEGAATLVYGVLAIGLLFIAALTLGAKFAMFGAVLTAALTYTFQMITLQIVDPYTRGAQAFAGIGAGLICIVWTFSFLLLIAGK